MIIQIVADELDFHLWYEYLSELQEAENKDQFPPRFKVKLNCLNPSDPNTLDLTYKIDVIRNGEKDRCLSLNVFILGSRTIQPGLVML